MPEYFEITLFDEERKKSEEHFELIKNIFDTLFTEEFMNQYCKNDYGMHENIEYFQYEGVDWIEYEINIPDFKIFKSDFENYLILFLSYIDKCYRKISSLRFATGIYELTSYYVGNINSINEFNYDFFKKFPLVFFRKDNMKLYGYDEAYIEYESTVCCYNKENTQSIFMSTH